MRSGPCDERSPPTVDLTQVDQAFAALRSRLGSSLAAVYLYGSTTTGGLRPDSDLDLLIATRRPLRGVSRAHITQDLLSISAPPGDTRGRRPLEVTAVVVEQVIPWRYPPMCEFQFGEWLRRDLLAGRIPPPRPDADLAILLATVRSRSSVLMGPSAAELFEPVPASDVRRAVIALYPSVIAHARRDRDERNAVLTLARMWVTLTSGEILPKDEAAERMLTMLPDEHRDVLALARSAYLGKAQDDWSSRTQQVKAFLRYASGLLTGLIRGRC